MLLNLPFYQGTEEPYSTCTPFAGKLSSLLHCYTKSVFFTTSKGANAMGRSRCVTTPIHGTGAVVPAILAVALHLLHVEHSFAQSLDVELCRYEATVSTDLQLKYQRPGSSSAQELLHLDNDAAFDRFKVVYLVYCVPYSSS